MDIKVTQTRIFKINQRGILIGYANVILNDCFIIKGIKILETADKKRFVAMPSRRLKGEKRVYRDICHPLNQEMRDTITTAIFDEYDAKST